MARVNAYCDDMKYLLNNARKDFTKKEIVGRKRRYIMTTQTVILKFEDQTVRTAIEKLISAIPGYIIEVEDTTDCDLLIFEITDKNADGQFDLSERPCHQGAQATSFWYRVRSTPIYWSRVLKFEPESFFQLPLNLEDVKNALLRFQTAKSDEDARANAKPAKEGTIIHVIGSKGGVGTTTVAVNLATSLLGPDSGKTVALLDMNLLFGDIPIFLGIESPQLDWAEIARNISRLDSRFLMGTLHKHPSGLYVLPSPTSIFEVFSAGPEIITQLLKLMKTMFDYIVIDGGQDLGDMAKSIMQLADRVILVTLLNLPSLINVKRLRETFLWLGYPSDDRVSIVANRVQKRSGNISLKDVERTVKKKIAWTVPNDFQNTMNAINMGKPLADIAPGSEITKHISEIAMFFQGKSVGGEDTNKRGFFGSYTRLVDTIRNISLVPQETR